MTNDRELIDQLKLNLFELIHILDDYRRREIMEMLSARIHNVLHATHIEFVMYNRWQLQEKIIYYSHQPFECLKEIELRDYMPYFNSKTNVSVVEKNDDLVNFFDDKLSILLKLHGEEKYYGLVCISFEAESSPSKYGLEKIRMEIENFLKILYKNRHDRYIHRRDNILFQLSTRLQSIHRTTDVLQRVVTVLRILFTGFNISLLMSKEYEDSNLPIKLIEYSSDTPLSAGTSAFINNTIQVEYDDENQTTTFYSPLSGAQGVYGVLQVEAPLILVLEQEEFKFIERFSNMVGRAIERTTLYQSSTQQVADLQTINYTTHKLNLNLDQKEIISIVKKEIFNSCYAEHFAAVLRIDEKEELEILQGSSKYFNTLTGQVFIEYIHNEVMKMEKALFLGDFKGSSLDVPFKSIMAIPLQSSDTILGIIIVVHSQPYFFSFDAFKLIQSIVQHASLALSNTILKEQLKKTVITDYLTQLYSRNYLDSVIKSHMSDGHLGSFILFDIDNFKQVNDTYGHYIGDQILITVAKLIKEVIHKEDIAARWGGEEFAIYLPNIDLEGAVEIANNIRKKVNEHTDPKVSVSCGVSMWENGTDDTIENLFIRTDEALYKAKESGKNKVITKTINGT